MVCLVFIEPIHDKIRHIPIIIRGGVYTALIFAGEFLTWNVIKNYSRKMPLELWN